MSDSGIEMHEGYEINDDIEDYTDQLQPKIENILYDKK